MEPLWGEPTDKLLLEFLAAGGAARIVSVRSEKLDPAWLGRELEARMLEELRRLQVDPCGEHGEYHTLVTRWPAFRLGVRVRPGGAALRDGYWALDLHLEA